MKKTLYVLALVILFHVHIHAQTKTTPQIGKPMPSFTFTEILAGSEKEISLASLKGKWVVLDFWATGCTSCIAKFPKVNEWQKELSDKVKFILAGATQLPEKEKAFYEKFRAKYNLQLTSVRAYDVFKQWDGPYVPWVFVIDPQGVLVSMPSGTQFTLETLSTWINTPTTNKITYKTEFVENPNAVMPFQISKAVPGASISELSRYNPQTDKKSIRTTFDNYDHLGFFRTSGTPLILLYKTAYLGNISWFYTDPKYKTTSPEVIIESEQASLFNVDWDAREGLYNYLLMLPEGKNSEADYMHAMQLDLQKYFSLDASVESRPMDVWELVIDNTALTHRLFEPPAFEKEKSGHDGLRMKNKTLDRMLSILGSSIEGQEPLFNMTGITGNVSIELDTVVADVNDLRIELKKYGLDIQKAKHMMNALVIK